MGLAVVHLAFNVPQSIVMLKPPVFDAAGVHGLAGLGGGQWQSGTSVKQRKN
jgi:hypothetical protein